MDAKKAHPLTATIQDLWGLPSVFQGRAVLGVGGGSSGAGLQAQESREDPPCNSLRVESSQSQSEGEGGAQAGEPLEC